MSAPSTSKAPRLVVADPATGLDFDEVALDDASTVRAAVMRAEQAQLSWAALPANDRADRLQAFADALKSAAHTIAPIMSREGGKPLVEALFEVQFTASVFAYFAGLARNRGGRVAPAASATSTSFVIREPLGVIGAIVPWNYPLLLWSWKAAPALASGNCVVAKPSPETPLSLPAACALMTLPDGVHQIVQGGPDVGTALVRDPGIAKIAFTGSTTTGKAILRDCADDAKRCSVEMSGHDAAIVWDDVDLDVAVEAVLFAAFSNAGQVCTSAERIYVRDTIIDQFTEKLTARVRALRIGDPLDVRTQVGPLVSEAHRARIESYLANAVAAGARVRTGGQRLPRPGSWFEPTVITNLSHDAANALGEIFGPIAPVMPIATFDEGIRKANENRFGLSANVLTSSLANAMRAARDLKVGTVWINNPLMDNLAAPFGGFREAGIGRELGEEGFDAFTEAKHVWVEPELIEQYYWFRQRDDHLHLLDGSAPA